jgi:hypothetical protein
MKGGFHLGSSKDRSSQQLKGHPPVTRGFDAHAESQTPLDTSAQTSLQSSASQTESPAQD